MAFAETPVLRVKLLQARLGFNPACVNVIEYKSLSMRKKDTEHCLLCPNFSPGIEKSLMSEK